MKALIPAAGIGKRLRPHTYTTAKPLLYLAGKPIISHILDELISLGIDEFILVVGHFREKIIDYLQKNYSSYKISYINQPQRKGLGHAVYLSKEIVGEEPFFVVYGDSIFKGISTDKINKFTDGSIGVKEVSDPSGLGLVCVKNGKITEFVEKPEKPVSNLAIVGFNYIKNPSLLFDSLKELIEKNIKTKGEYQLTDAFKLMVKKGASFSLFPVENWFDCGKVETLLETNRHLLRELQSSRKFENSVLIPPVFVSETAEISNSVVGPYVSVAEKVFIEDSIVKNSIINKGAYLKESFLQNSIAGENASVKGSLKELNIGDSSRVQI